MCCLLKMQILKYISRNFNFVNIIRFVVHFLQELCSIDRMGFCGYQHPIRARPKLREADSVAGVLRMWGKTIGLRHECLERLLHVLSVRHA
jgi:hypothetical protein